MWLVTHTQRMRPEWSALAAQHIAPYTCFVRTRTNNQLFDVNEAGSAHEYVDFKIMICQKKRIYAAATWAVLEYRHNGAKQSEWRPWEDWLLWWCGVIEVLPQMEGQCGEDAPGHNLHVPEQLHDHEFVITKKHNAVSYVNYMLLIV